MSRMLFLAATAALALTAATAGPRRELWRPSAPNPNASSTATGGWRPAPQKATPQQRARGRPSPIPIWPAPPSGCAMDRRRPERPGRPVPPCGRACAPDRPSTTRPPRPSSACWWLNPEQPSTALIEKARDYDAEGQGFYAIDPAKSGRRAGPDRLAAAVAARHRPTPRSSVATRPRRSGARPWRCRRTIPAVLSNMAMAIAAQGDLQPGPKALLAPGRGPAERGLAGAPELRALMLGLQGRARRGGETAAPGSAARSGRRRPRLSAGPSPPAATSRPGPGTSKVHNWTDLKDAGG